MLDHSSLFVPLALGGTNRDMVMRKKSYSYKGWFLLLRSQNYLTAAGVGHTCAKKKCCVVLEEGILDT